MVKNTGIPENQLSDLDYGQVLKDSHNKPLHALDVNVINSLVPSSFSKVVPSVDSYGRVSNVKYYGLGLPEIINLVILANAQGKSEIIAFSFIGLNPTDIAGKYITIYDSLGKIGVWFDLDNGSVQPSVSGAIRYIEVDIATGDSATNLASKFSSVLSLDSQFTAVPYMSTSSIVQNNFLGIRTDATSGNTAILTAVGQQGIDSLAGKLFYLWKADNSDKYAFYFTIDGSGTVPSYSGISITQIALLSSDTITQIASKTSLGIASIPYFSAVATDGGQLRVSYRSSGDTTGFQDSNTGISSEVVQNGQNIQLVQELIITYPTVCGQPTIEALL